MSRIRIKHLFLLLLLALPACTWGSASRVKPTTYDTNVMLPQSPVDTPASFAENRKITGPGQRMALHPMPSVPLSTDPEPDEEPPVRVSTEAPGQLPVQVVVKPDPPLIGAVRDHMDDQPQAAIEKLKSYGKPNQELLLQLIPAMVQASRANLVSLDSPDAGVLANQLESTAALLKNKASISIEKTIFCRSVKNFGHYDPLPADAKFKPGEIYILYVEIGNVPCTPASQNGVDGYLTRLNCTLQLRDTANKVLELTGKNGQHTTELVESKVDFSRSPLKDYFMLFWFAAPNKPGKYVVNFKVRDPNTGREISKSEPFWVGN